MGTPDAAAASRHGNFLDDRRVAKDKTQVVVTFGDGSGMRGFFYLADGQRVADLLGDGRRFVPFLDIGGGVRLLDKVLIVEVKPA